MSGPWSDQVERNDSLSDGDYQMREVYAHFGVAVYMAHVLEHGVVNLLAVTEVVPKAKSQDEYDALIEETFKYTLGPLVKRLVKQLSDDDSLNSDLADALENRNYIVHRFWRQRVQLTAMIAGCNRLIDELGEIESLFESVDKRLDRLLFSLSDRPGAVSREQVQKIIHDEKETLVALNGYLPDELPDLGGDR